VGVEHEERQAIAPLPDLLLALRPRYEEYRVGPVRQGHPYLLAVDNVLAGPVLCVRLYIERVDAGHGLRVPYAEYRLPLGYPGQPLLLQAGAPELPYRVRPEHVGPHEEIPARDTGAVPRGLVRRHVGLVHVEPGAAVLLGDQEPQPSLLRERVPVLLGELLGHVLLTPVLPGELLHQIGHALPEERVLVRLAEVHAATRVG